MKILIAEDNPANSRLLEHILLKDGHTIKAVEDGQRALQLLEKEPFDALITDWMMPEVDGIQLIRAVRAKIRPQPIIIMVTSLTTPQTREYALKSGADDFIIKPFTGPVILKHLNDCLSRKEQQKPELPTETPEAPKVKPPFVGVVMTSSSGGPFALTRVIPFLKNPGRAAYFLVQHGPGWMLESLAQSLGAGGGIKVHLARDGMIPMIGNLYLAPGERHMFLEGSPPVIRVKDGPEENFVKPAADPLFRSAATIFGSYCIGVVLTGLGRDGTRGAAQIASAKGKILVQDPATATMHYMPQSVIEAGIPHQSIQLDNLAAFIEGTVNVLAQDLK